MRISAIGTQSFIEAIITLGTNRKTQLLAKPNHQEVSVTPQLLGHPGLQSQPGFLGSLGGALCPPKSVADAVNMSVHTCTIVTRYALC